MMSWVLICYFVVIDSWLTAEIECWFRFVAPCDIVRIICVFMFVLWEEVRMRCSSLFMWTWMHGPHARFGLSPETLSQLWTQVKCAESVNVQALRAVAYQWGKTWLDTKQRFNQTLFLSTSTKDFHCLWLSCNLRYQECFTMFPKYNQWPNSGSHWISLKVYLFIQWNHLVSEQLLYFLGFKVGIISFSRSFGTNVGSSMSNGELGGKWLIS